MKITVSILITTLVMFAIVRTDCVQYLGVMSRSNLHLHHHVDYIHYHAIKLASSLHIFLRLLITLEVL
jgi:hypothetical protein